MTGRTALVSGGSRGIGRGISLAMARAGADVAFLFRRRKEEAERTRGEIEDLGRRSLAIQLDVSDVAALAGAIDTVVQEMGRLDALVNNAAIAELVPFARVTPDLLERTLRVNVMAPFFLAQAAARHMIGNQVKGRIINITSTNGFVAEALLSPYNASKGALELLTRSLAIELGPHGITVNSVAPGLIETEIAHDFPLSPGFWDAARQHIPLGRLGTAADVAGAVVFLAGEAGRYITGQHIIVDGGLLADQFPRMPFYTGPR